MKEIHIQVFSHLFQYYLTEDLLFSPRKINNSGRLDSGLLFRGNQDYLSIGFCRGDDLKQKIHNIGFVINSSHEIYLELSSTDKVPVYKLLQELGNKIDGLEDVGNGKFFKYYETGDYIKALDYFIAEDLPIILDFLKARENENIGPLDDSIRSAIGRAHSILIEDIDNKSQDSSELSEEPITRIIQNSIQVIDPVHKKIQNNLKAYIKSLDHSNLEIEKDRIDLQSVNPSGQKCLFEVKPIVSKYAIRLAIGQLLEYAYTTNNMDALLYVVSNYNPSHGDLAYMKYLKMSHSIDLRYIYAQYANYNYNFIEVN